MLHTCDPRDDYLVISSEHCNGKVWQIQLTMPTKRTTVDLEEDAVPKRQNTEMTTQEVRKCFNAKVWDERFQEEMKEEIEHSEPYRWGTIKELMDDTLLRNVRKEMLREIAFTQKETDIYKVYQSGDLANMSRLDWNDLSRLPSLYKLRAAIYSEEFRDMVSRVTGCGKLSGVKTDMSLNTYNKGCHLLTHDDVIGSRRLSFILYLPDPDKLWKSHYGGGLRLYPALLPNVPKTDYSVKLVPQFNQIAFFKVQPGLSFHDVEEVRVDRQRMSIQGWFHIPQSGEEGYIKGEQEETEARSTLQQLQSKELQEYDFPKPIREDISFHEISLLEKEVDFLSESEFSYLGAFLNPTYLQKDNFENICNSFLENSLIELKDFLNPDYSEALRTLLRKEELENKTPQTSKDISFPWKCAVPPHKQRYMYLDGREDIELSEKGITEVNKIAGLESPNFALSGKCSSKETDKKLCELARFFKSIAFRKWLKLVTQLVVTSQQVLVRRFRPGHDFILATSTDKDLARPNSSELNLLLEATMNITSSASNPKNWDLGEFGGYELCMASKDADDSDYEEDDPAIYKASNSKDDSVLYTSQCQWNTLCLMLRDPLVLKFVKYVSINAKGSRWDISCQWNVKSADFESSDEENEE